MSIRKLTVTSLVALGVIATGLMSTCPSTLASELLLHEYGKTFGTAGSGDGQFKEPVKIAVDEITGDVYVADRGNGRIQEFDAEGNYLAQFDGSETPNPNVGEFSPQYLAVDNACAQHQPALTGTECEEYDPSAGDVYVLDAANNVIDKFDSAGKYLSRLGTPVSAPFLWDVAVNSSGNPITITSEESHGGEGGYIEVYDNAVDNNLVTETLLTEAGLSGHRYTGPVGGRVGLAVSPNANEGLFLLHGEGQDGAGLVSRITSQDEVDDDLFIGAYTFGGGVDDIAVDMAGSEIFTDIGSAVIAYTSVSLEKIQEFGEAQLSGSAGMAVNSTTHTVYASDTANNNVEIFVEVVLPTLTSEPVSNVTSRSVTLNGTVLPKGGLEANTIEFEYGTSNGPNVTVAASPTACPAGGTSCAVSANVMGLLPNTTYHYRLLADNSHDKQEITGEESFTTSAEVPAVENESTSAIAQTSAMVVANIDPEHDETTYYFQYGADTKYGTVIPVPDAIVGSGYTAVKVGESITGLQPGQTYHYRVVATNPAGPPVDGPDQTFTTLAPTPPVVGATTVNNVSQNSVSVSGIVNPEGVQSSYEFDLGVDTSYGTSTFGNTGFGTEQVSVNATFSGLAPDTTYHYRLLATNVYGTTYGPDQTFTTPGYPTATLSGPLTPILLAVPVVSFPSYTTAVSTPKAKKPSKKKVKQKKRKQGKVARRGQRHASSGRRK